VPEVLVGKRIEQFPVERFTCDPIHDLQVLFKEMFTVEGKDLLPDAHEETVGGENGHEDEPKPDEDEDFLIEQIHGKHALKEKVRDESDGDKHLARTCIVCL
jgi:hypothetical protein